MRKQRPLLPSLPRHIDSDDKAKQIQIKFMELDNKPQKYWDLGRQNVPRASKIDFIQGEWIVDNGPMKRVSSLRKHKPVLEQIHDPPLILNSEQMQQWNRPHQTIKTIKPPQKPLPKIPHPPKKRYDETFFQDLDWSVDKIKHILHPETPEIQKPVTPVEIVKIQKPRKEKSAMSLEVQFEPLKVEEEIPEEKAILTHHRPERVRGRAIMVTESTADIKWKWAIYSVLYYLGIQRDIDKSPFQMKDIVASKRLGNILKISKKQRSDAEQSAAQYLIGQIDALQLIPHYLRRNLLSICSWTVLPKGHLVYKQGQDVDYLYIVMMGQLQLTETRKNQIALQHSICIGQPIYDFKWCVTTANATVKTMMRTEMMTILRKDWEKFYEYSERHQAYQYELWGAIPMFEVLDLEVLDYVVKHFYCQSVDLEKYTIIEASQLQKSLYYFVKGEAAVEEHRKFIKRFLGITKQQVKHTTYDLPYTEGMPLEEEDEIVWDTIPMGKLSEGSFSPIFASTKYNLRILEPSECVLIPRDVLPVLPDSLLYQLERLEKYFFPNATYE
ncbi:hypothetical protein EDD86DRAFT_203498 [Gorgonomyces haynaldii]|nr:hypothetical protein EDD86DRAFT_203498 [Gorgonomyces haynaldii]